MRIKVVNKSPFPLPKYETSGAAGMDLMADFSRLDQNNWHYKLMWVNKVVCSFNTEKTILSQNEAVHPVDTITLEPFSRVIIPTGLYFQIEEGYEVQIRPRSGLSFKTGLTIANSPGTIDEDYRGEIGIICANYTDRSIMIKHGDRIAQMVVNKYEECNWIEVEELEQTKRGDGSFGSTGK